VRVPRDQPDQVCGAGRVGPNRPKKTNYSVRYQITRLRRIAEAIRQREGRQGWRVQVTNMPAERLSLRGSLLT
jgi:hypothetical protein